MSRHLVKKYIVLLPLTQHGIVLKSCQKSIVLLALTRLQKSPDISSKIVVFEEFPQTQLQNVQTSCHIYPILLPLTWLENLVKNTHKFQAYKC